MNRSESTLCHARRRLLLVAVALLLGATIASCGDSTDEAPDATTSTAPVPISSSSSTSTTTATSTSKTTTSTSVPVTVTSETTDPSAVTVDVYFSSGEGSDCSSVNGFPRPVDPDDDPLESAFRQLVGGPTAEEINAGAGSFFTTETSAAIHSLGLTDGLLVVDFGDIRAQLNNASTSCGSAALLAQLNQTAFQFVTVERTRYQINGSCDLFGHWLQRECFESDRSGSSPATDDTVGPAGSGCTPEGSDGLPDGRWFGFIAETDAVELTFDLACWYSGSAATVAADEDGAESPPPNDYYIRNTNARLRTVPVAQGADVVWMSEPGDPATTEVISYETWVASRLDRSFQPGVWISVTGGLAAAIEEQYVP